METKENKLDVFTMTEQPVNCTRCGSRTEFEEINNHQHHICLNESCGYHFIVTND